MPMTAVGLLRQQWAQAFGGGILGSVVAKRWYSNIVCRPILFCQSDNVGFNTAGYLGPVSTHDNRVLKGPLDCSLRTFVRSTYRPTRQGVESRIRD